MKEQSFSDPYRVVLDHFNRLGVRYVVIGMSGINYYATGPADTFATLDYDIFLDPSLENVKKAVRALEKLGFTIGTAEGLLEKKTGLQEAIFNQRTLVAATTDGVLVELLLRVSGYPFSELHKDAATFTVRGVPVRVGRLTKLLESKRIAARPKDREFLRRYQSLLFEDSKKPRMRKRK